MADRDDLKSLPIDGLDLDAAIDKILVERPIFAAREAAPEIKAQADLEAKALAGNVTAYAQLSKQLGPTAFAAWRAKHGNINAGQRPKAADKVDPANPWSGDGDRAAQLAIIRAPGGAAKVGTPQPETGDNGVRCAAPSACRDRTRCRWRSC
jgi:hypothetical protein